MVSLQGALNQLELAFGEETSRSNPAVLLQSGKFSSSSPAPPSQPQGLSYAEDAAEHENMKAVLKTSSPALEDATPVGVRLRSRASRGNSCQQGSHPAAFSVLGGLSWITRA